MPDISLGTRHLPTGSLNLLTAAARGAGQPGMMGRGAAERSYSHRSAFIAVLFTSW